MTNNKFFCAMIVLVTVAVLCCACTRTQSAHTPTVTTVSDTPSADYVLKLPANELSAAVGDTGEVEYIYTGPGTVTVSSNDPQVLQIENGRYKPVSPGLAVITCTDGKLYAQCIVTVTEADFQA